MNKVEILVAITILEDLLKRMSEAQDRLIGQDMLIKILKEVNREN